VSHEPGADHPEPIGPGEVDPETGLRPHSLQPRRPRTLGGAVYLAVLGVCAGALLLVLLGYWRTGLVLMGGAFLAAGLGRWVLPDANAGMLHLRRKAIDVPTLLLIGFALIVVANIIRGRLPG
jgi:hypothetical protein